MIFVPSTPHSQLKNKYQQMIRETTLRIKVVETAGEMLRGIVQRSNPFGQTKCETTTRCMVCTGGRGQCKRENITYEIRCSECKCIYVGETSRTAHYRGRQHRDALDRKDPKSILWQHTKEKHNNQSPKPQYNMRVTSSQKTALERQITEAVKIERVPDEHRLNSREEWGHTRLIRAALTYR